MPEQWTQELSDKLADLIWWIKGYNCAMNNDLATRSDLDCTHIEALRRARALLDSKKETS